MINLRRTVLKHFKQLNNNNLNFIKLTQTNLSAETRCCKES